jgi:integrase
VLRRQANGVWHVDFQCMGKRVHRSARTKDRRRAQAIEDLLRRKLTDQALHGEPLAQGMATLGETADRYYLEHLKPHARRAKSLDGERIMLWALVRRLGGSGVRLEEIGSAQVANLKAALLAEGKAKATVNRYLSVLSALLKKASREWGLRTASPTIQLFRLDNARTRVLSAEEEVRLLADLELHNPPLLALVRFLLGTGARLGEALNLTWEDAQLEGPLPKAVFRLTKNGGTRAVPLNASLVEMLKHARRVKGCSSVFLSKVSGGTWGPYKQPHSGFAFACRRAQVHDLRIHDLRHTFASRLVERGASLYQVGALLGHRDPRMTARYSHLSGESLHAAVLLLNAPHSPTAPSTTNLNHV